MISKMHVTGVAERAELLNNYFCSVCTLDDGNVPAFKCSRLTADTFIDHITFNPTSIKRAIARLKSNLATVVSSEVIVYSLLEPLTLLYSHFYQSAGYPMNDGVLLRCQFTKVGRQTMYPIIDP